MITTNSNLEFSTFCSCIFGELLLGEMGLFKGAEEIKQLELIYQLCGTPTGETAEILSKLDGWSKMQFEKTYPNTMLRKFARLNCRLL